MTISGLPPIGPAAGAAAPRPIDRAAAPATPGREPGLWAMLSSAERAFFLAPTEQQAIGYGPGGARTEAAPVLGQHLDVRG
ncbi:MAG: hypothetical protein KC544_02765 [Gemmatimonadetes bacterium]|nr:hypothetical protein [Gemmatimonadota bacterium]MCA9769677.1 hypothetical protein [Gemmatimonadota bacterium]MCB9518987.1 hypothetical protein [Gemmatimonadales bacterium]HPF62777.1 hypothetical protein [Gemmatimonadales bacterium]HRX19947.1 hypothetical protein [Gemmatimonadales bacterium]